MFALPIAAVLGIGYYINQIRPPSNVKTAKVEENRGLLPAGGRDLQQKNSTHIRNGSFDDRVPKINLRPEQVMQPLHRGMQPKGPNLEKMDAIDRRLENFTGMTHPDYTMPKAERRATVQDTRNLNRNPDIRQMKEDRIHKSNLRNNSLPFNQQRETAGLGLGYQTSSSDPTQQYLYKKQVEQEGVVTTEQLRGTNRPKTDDRRNTFVGAPNLGYKPHSLGQFTRKVHKKEHEQGPGSWIRSTGSFLKGMLRPKKVLSKPQWRGLKDSGANAFQGMSSKYSKAPARGQHSDPMRQERSAGANTFRGGANIRRHGLSDDRGRRSIMLRSTNRQHPKYARVRYGNATTQVSALAKPLVEKLRHLRRLYDIRNTVSNFTGPAKGPAYDPETMKGKTTHRETTLTSAPAMNFSGPLKGIAYDPETAAARTTIRETTLTSTPFANLSGPIKGIVYDPQMVAKTTHRETTLSATPAMNFSGPKKMSVQNGVSRTTMRQMNTDAGTPAMNFSGPLKSIAYDPQQTAKTTMRETMLTDLRQRHGGNIDAGFRELGNAMYDTRNKDLARPTQRESYEEGDIYRNLEAANKELPQHNRDSVPEPTMRDLIGETNYFEGGAESDVSHPAARMTLEELEEQIRQTMRGLDEIEHYTPSQSNGIGAYSTASAEGIHETNRGLSDMLDFRGTESKDQFKNSSERDSEHTHLGTRRDEAFNKAKDLPPIKEGVKNYYVKECKLNPHKAMGKNQEQTERNTVMIERKTDEHAKHNLKTFERSPLGERTRKTPKWKEDASTDHLLEQDRDTVRDCYMANPFSVPSGLLGFEK